MALFRIADKRANKLEKLDETGFANEREIQHTTEKNLQNILGLDFVCSEFSVKNRRIDTLAFDEEENAFVIIEYKIGKNHSVVDQGMNYLSLMLENQADFVLKYNEEKNLAMRINQINWSSSRVIFISGVFTSVQKGAANFKDFTVDLWEVKKYENDVIVYKQVEKSVARASVKELSSKGKNTAVKEESVERVIREIKTYTEEDHFNEGNKDMEDLYEKFKSGIQNLDENIIIKANKYYIAFATNFNIVCIKIQRNQLRLLLNIPTGKLNDPMAIAEDVADIGRHGTGDYRIYIKSDENFEYVLSLVRQALKYGGRKKGKRQ